MEKQKYYVSLQRKGISEIQYHDNDSITIFATPEEVELLRTKLNNIDDAEVNSFWRAHVPIKPYHDDKPNQDHDKNLSEALGMIYKLGDEQARDYILESGLLGDRPVDSDPWS